MPSSVLPEHIDHVLAAVVGIADVMLPDRIDHEALGFQRKMTDQHGTIM